MKKVFESADYLMIGHLKNLLMNEGIQCRSRNEYLAAAAREIPLSETWYEIWVEEDSQVEEAERIIKTALSDEYPSGPEWTCPGCGEVQEYQFTVCWNCGREKPLK
jgi:rubrerythrin